MTYGHLQADCLYTGISSGPNVRYRVWEAFTFTFLLRAFTEMQPAIIFTADNFYSLPKFTNTLQYLHLKRAHSQPQSEFVHCRLCLYVVQFPCTARYSVEKCRCILAPEIRLEYQYAKAGQPWGKPAVYNGEDLWNTWILSLLWNNGMSDGERGK